MVSLLCVSLSLSISLICNGMKRTKRANEARNKRNERRKREKQRENEAYDL